MHMRGLGQVVLTSIVHTHAGPLAHALAHTHLDGSLSTTLWLAEPNVFFFFSDLLKITSFLVIFHQGGYS